MKQKLLLFFILLATFSTYANIIYVKAGSSGDGTSWSQAHGDLSTALQQAVAGDEIWVAQGTYYPSSASNPSASFLFKDGVKMYGGFSGTESSLADRADTTGQTTILSGALSSSIQSQVILKILQANHSNNLIDGFTIKGGKRVLQNGENGGVGVQVIQSTIVLQNCIIKDNILQATNYAPTSNAKAGGAGIYAYQSHLHLSKVKVLNNTLQNTVVNTGNGGVGFVYGAGIYAYQGSFSSEEGRVENNRINYNGFAGFGAGAYFESVSSIQIKKNWIQFNSSDGENIQNTPSGAGIYFNNCPSILLYGSIFHGNFTSKKLDASFSYYGEGNALTFQNSSGNINQNTFGYNAKEEDLREGYGDNIRGIYIGGLSQLVFNNSAFLQTITGQGMVNQSIAYNKCVSKFPIGFADDPHVIWGIAEFVNPLEGDYTPLYCSRSINFGDAQFADSSTDLKNNPRIIGANVDVGAIEFQNPGDYTRVYVDQANTTSANEGVTWQSAYSTVQEALNCKCKDAAGNVIMPEEIWIAEGIYTTGKRKEDSFFLNNGQKIYGGFASGATDLTQRDTTWQTNQTILSGKYKEGAQANHVVSSLFNYVDTELNTVIVQDGQTKSEGHIEELSGAGILVRGQTTLRNVWVRNNKADGNYVEGPNSYQQHNGGGILVYRFDGYGAYQFPKIPTGIIAENVKISDNIAGGLGAGISMVLSYIGTKPENNFVTRFTNVEISNNQSKRNDDKFTNAGALHVEGHFDIVMEDFLIDHNAAVTSSAIQVSHHEGAYIHFKRGEISNNHEILGVNESARGYALTFNTVGQPNSVVFENVLIHNNSSKRGMFNAYQTNIKLHNVTFTQNHSEIYERFGFFMSSNLEIKNSIIDLEPSELPFFGFNINGLTATASHSLFSETLPAPFTNEGGVLENGNPEFVSSANANFHLLPNSPAIDSGSNALLSSTNLLDLDGNARIYNQTVDMGVYEFNGTVSTHQPTKNAVISLYPNPATDRVFVTFNDTQSGRLVLYDAVGKKVVDRNQITVSADQPLEINVSSLASGMYLVHWITDKATTSVKLIKK